MTRESEAGGLRTAECLIVGAGMAGLTAARRLRAAGIPTILVDKGRGAGGRMATRRVGEGRVDHGAQLLVAWTSSFRGQLHAWRDAGLVTAWPIAETVRDFPAPIHQLHSIPLRVVGGMSALPRRLADGHDVRLEERIVLLARDDAGWAATTDDGCIYRARAVLLTPPLPQALELLDAGGIPLPPEQEDALRAVDYERCLTLIAQLDGPTRIEGAGLLLPPPGSPVRLVVDQQRKGTSERGALVTLHATHDTSNAAWDLPGDRVATDLFDAVADLVGAQMVHWQLHRWRFSRPRHTLGVRCAIVSSDPPLLLAGDAFGPHLIESAWESGRAAGDWLVERLAPGEQG